MKEFICIICPKGCHLAIQEATDAVTGNGCDKGIDYAREELHHPVRVVTSTVRVNGGMHARCPVKTDLAIPKGQIFDAMRLLDEVELVCPIKSGQIVIKNILNTGANFVATRSLSSVSGGIPFVEEPKKTP